MVAGEEPLPRNLRATVGAAEDEVQVLLSTEGAPVLEVISWLSAHFAALDRAVYPVVRRSLPDGKAIVAAQRQQVSRISHLLRVLERHHSGDILASSLDPLSLAGELRPLVAEQSRSEAALVDQLDAVLDDAAQAALADDYDKALRRAPTRPHPHLSRAGPLTPLVFWMDSARDRLLDTMDNRHVPVPRRPRRLVRPGMWGSYWLGQQNDGQPTDPTPPRPR